ncbi:MAG TPA: hypothetical protein PLF32_08420 [Bacteroidales bacterium]|nr:hypothetical protein [Bacteroidales bacterium]HOR82666.1 hypothetical protein [Bacteroidales bacterium]HPJ92041.1 hypothetical protein [Bacteroidales bacterium]
MTKKIKLLLATFFLICISFQAQNQNSTKIDNKSLIETKNGGLLIFNNFNNLDLYFYIDYKGGQVKITERHNLFEVGGMTLQVLALEKNKYIGKTDQETLENHAKSEVDHIGNYLKVNLKLKTEKIIIKGQKDCLLWYCKMPETISKEVKNQLFISFIYKGYIIGINTDQFSNQTFNEIVDFLKVITENTFYSDERITLEYLCNKR